jgi:ABC-type uncharacterized transport system auxiliary subunit
MIDKVARLGSITVAAPYDKSALAVKRADGSVAFDSYNVFASAPSALLRTPLAVLLENDGRFGRILSSVSTARSNYTLEAVVTDLSLDCTAGDRRVAKVSISIAVIENREIKMFLDGSGSADAASGDYSEAFSAAFSQAVSDALRSMPEK